MNKHGVHSLILLGSSASTRSFLSRVCDLLVTLVFEGAAGQCSLLRLNLSLDKTPQLLIPVTWKAVRHKGASHSCCKPEDRVEGSFGLIGQAWDRCIPYCGSFDEI